MFVFISFDSEFRTVWMLMLPKLLQHWVLDSTVHCKNVSKVRQVAIHTDTKTEKSVQNAKNRKQTNSR